MSINVCKYMEKGNNKPCTYYLRPGMCMKDTMFRCIEYIKRFEPTMSYSSVNHFMRCPRLYYLADIKGVQLGEQFQSDALQIGKWVDRYITQDTNQHELEPSLWYMKALAIRDAFNKIIKLDRNKFKEQNEFHWQEDGCPQVHGFIDLSAQNHFIELKCTSKPAYYINPYWIYDQLGTYFLSNPNFEFGIMWVIRVPQLKQIGNFRDESLEDYRDRCIRDMIKRPSYYFTGYDKDKKSFGFKFYRSEFDLNALRDRYKWLAKQIRECVQTDYFYQNKTQCLFPFQCDMFRICEIGGINDDIYNFRGKERR